MKLDVDVPQELIDLLAQSKLAQLEPDRQVQVALALHLFVSGEVSRGRAAELAGLRYLEFDHVVLALGLPTVEYGPEQLAEDMAFADEVARRHKAG
jgi:predicted HTH domain antitoxin